MKHISKKHLVLISFIVVNAVFVPIMNQRDIMQNTTNQNKYFSQEILPTGEQYVQTVNNLTDYTQSPFESYTDITPNITDPIEDLGSLNPYMEDSITDLGSLNDLTNDPLSHLGNLNTYSEDSLTHLNNLNKYTEDISVYLGISASEFTYMNTSDQLAFSYGIFEGGTFQVHYSHFYIPYDAVSVVVEGDLLVTSNSVVEYYYGFHNDAHPDGEMIGQSIQDTCTFSSLTSLGNEYSLIEPGSMMTVAVYLTAIGDTADINIFATRNYTYANATDELSMDFSLISPAKADDGGSGACIEMVSFTIPNDALSVNLHFDASLEFGVTAYKEDHTALFNFYGTSTDEVIITHLADATSIVFPGEQITLLFDFAYKGIMLNGWVQSSRNYTYFNSSDQVSFDFNWISPATASGTSPVIEKIIFQIPLGSMSINFVGIADSAMGFVIYRDDDLLFNNYGENFNEIVTTSLGDPYSLIFPGDQIVVVFEFEIKNTILDCEIRSTRNYTYVNASDILAVEWDVSSPGNMGSVSGVVERMIFQVPMDASFFWISSPLTDYMACQIYRLRDGHIFLDTLEEFTYCMPTKMANPGSILCPGDILIIDMFLTLQGESTHFKMLCSRNYSLPHTETYENRLAFDFEVSAPENRSENIPYVERVILQVPKDANSIIISTKNNIEVGMELTSSNGTLIFSCISLGFTKVFQTNLSDINSLIIPDEILIIDIFFQQKNLPADFRIWANHQYQYSSSQMDLAFTGGLGVNDGLRRETFQLCAVIPENAIAISCFGNFTTGTHVQLKNQTLDQIYNSTVGTTEFYCNLLTNATDISKSSNSLKRGDIIYLVFNFTSSIANCNFTLFSTHKIEFNESVQEYTDWQFSFIGNNTAYNCSTQLIGIRLPEKNTLTWDLEIVELDHVNFILYNESRDLIIASNQNAINSQCYHLNTTLFDPKSSFKPGSMIYLRFSVIGYQNMINFTLNSKIINNPAIISVSPSNIKISNETLTIQILWDIEDAMYSSEAHYTIFQNLENVSSEFFDGSDSISFNTSFDTIEFGNNNWKFRFDDGYGKITVMEVEVLIYAPPEIEDDTADDDITDDDFQSNQPFLFFGSIGVISIGIIVILIISSKNLK